MSKLSKTAVAPESLLDRRFKYPLSLDVPVGEGASHPLFGQGGVPGIFEHLNLHYVPPQGRVGGKIDWERPIFGRTSKGKPFYKNGLSSISLFTCTSKMAAPSFSLPAGPPTEGGTCVAANRAAGSPKRPGYVCDVCYAMQGHSYRSHIVSLAQAARLQWILQTLKQGGALALADQLVRAIDDFARTATLGSMDERMILELGVWHRGQLSVPALRPGARRPVLIPAFKTLLPPSTGFRDSEAYLASLQPREGQVTGFFRIHDSGDFNVGTSPKLWADYLDAWILTAKHFPAVIFWAPVRTWIFPKLQAHLQRATESAPNLVLRPSALRVGEPAPALPGLPAGSTVAKHLGPRLYDQPPQDARGRDTFVCPVGGSWAWDETIIKKRGEPGAWVNPKSCLEAGCRACWILQNTPTAYVEHN